MSRGFFDELRRRRVLRVAAVYIIAAWLVVQVADVFFPAWNVPAAGLRYLLIAAILGFPIALVFGWMYDITPHGIRRTPQADESEAPATLGRVDYITLGILAVAAAFIIYNISSSIVDVAQDGETASARVEKRANSIAVLPFVNVSDDPSNDYFCDGVSEEILHRLAEYRDMHVIARTSSFVFKDSALDAASLSSRLGVQYLLRGSVRKSGNSLRISAELVDDKNFQLWNQTFDRELDNVFAIQSEIAAAVARSLASTVLESHIAGSTYEPDINAYQHYLLGREFLRARAPGFETNAIEQFNAAIEYDSGYAAPHAGLAIAYLLSGRDATHYADRHDAADASIATALDLDADSAPAMAARGLLLSIRGDDAEAEAVLRRAIDLDPNVVGARVWLSNALFNQGKVDEHLRAREAALAFDPLDPRLATGVADRYNARGEYDKAEQQYRRLLQLPNPSQLVYSGLFRLYDGYGRYVEMIAAGKEWILAHAVPGSEPHYYFAYLAYGYARLGMFDEAHYWQSRAEAMPPVDMATVMRRAYIFRLQGKFAESGQTVTDALSKGGIDYTRASPFVRRVVGAVKVLNEDYEAAVEILESAFNIDEMPDLGSGGVDLVHALVYAHRQLGNDARADEIIETLDQGFARIQANGGGRNPEMLLVNAQNHVLAGRSDEAIATLAVAVDAGMRHYFWVTHDFRWESVQDDPRFQALLETMKADIDEQREQVEAIEAREDFRQILATALESM